MTSPDWRNIVILAVSEVRQFGAGSLQVNRRLRAMLEHLLDAPPEDRRMPIRDELELLGNAIERELIDEKGRKRAKIAGLRGVGESEN